jgi:hypothetical protein
MAVILTRSNHKAGHKPLTPLMRMMGLSPESEFGSEIKRQSYEQTQKGKISTEHL